MAWNDFLFAGDNSITQEQKDSLTRKGLLQAGLAIMAANGRPGVTPGQAIASGLLSGLGAVGEGQKSLHENDLDATRLGLAKQQLQQGQQGIDRQAQMDAIAKKSMLPDGTFNQMGYANDLAAISPALAQDYLIGVQRQKLTEAQARQKQTREIQQGSNVLTQEMDPASGNWNTIATAPRWQPQSSSRGPSAIEEKIALARKFGATDDDIRGMLGFGDLGSAPTYNPNGPTGEEFIKSLPVNDQPIVKAVIDGRYPIPVGKAAASPQWQRVVALATQADPTFDAGNYPARAKSRVDFTSGQAARESQALNTLAGHIATLKDAALELNNSRFKGYNRVANLIGSETGNPAIVKFKAAAKAVGDEAAKVFAGGQSALGDREKIESLLDVNNSPEQLLSTIDQYSELVGSRMDSLQQRANQGLGLGSRDVRIVGDKAAKLFGKKGPAQPTSTSGWSVTKDD